MRLVRSFLRDHATKVLGSAQAIISGFIVIPDLIPHGSLKYWAAGNVVLGVLTIGRGFQNSARSGP